jgi:hypothetical protein
LSAISVLLRHFYGALNVPSLCSLVAAAQQQDDQSTPLYKINAVTGTVIDTKFANALEVFDVPEKASLDPNEANGDTPPRFIVFQALKPIFENAGLAEFEHL